MCRASILFFFLMISLSLFSQNICGKVIDEQGKPVEYANVIILKNDSSFVCGDVTNEEGYFFMNAIPDTIIVKVSCIGFKQFIMPFPSAGDIGIIKLSSETYILDGVTIKKDVIQNHLGGYSIRLKNYEVVKGKQITEALEFLPNVTFHDAELYILNKEPSAIYVDGIKLNNLKELQDIPAEEVEMVSVDYQGGAERNTSNRGAILHIKLKQPVIGGYFGWFRGGFRETSYGWGGERISKSFKIQLRNISLYNTFSYRRRLLFSDSNEEKRFLNTAKNAQIDTRFRNWYNIISDRLSGICQIAPNHVIEASLLYMYEDNKPHYDSGIVEEAHSRRQTSYHSHDYSKTTQIQGYYMWNSDKDAKQFKLNIDYLHKTDHLSQMADEEITTWANQNTKMLRFKPMFIGNVLHGQCKIGLDAQFIWFDDRQSSLCGKMKSKSPSVFIEYEGQLSDRFQYGAGLRYQYNKMSVSQEDKNNTISHGGVYPNMQMMYIINPQKGHFFNMMFEYATQEIPYSAISTYRIYNSPYYYIVGNPNLNIPTQWSLTGMLTLFNKLSLTIGTTHLKDDVEYITKTDSQEPNISFDQAINADRIRTYLMALEVMIKPTKWWIAKPHMDLMITSGKWVEYEMHYDMHWRFSLVNSFSFTNTFGGQIDIQYEPPYHFANMKHLAVTDIHGGLYKNLLSDKLRISFDFVAYRHDRDIITNTPAYYSYFDNNTKNLGFELTVTWFFKGGKKAVKDSEMEPLQEYNKIIPVR